MSLRLLFVFSLLVITGRWALAFDMGPLNPYLESGASGPWTLTEQSGAAILDNRDADGDLTYFFVGPNSGEEGQREISCLLYTSPSPRDQRGSRMPSSA